MRKLSLGLLVFVLALSFGIAPALAFDASIYYFAGSSELKVDDSLTLGADTTTGFGAEVGIPISGPFGARVSYLDLGLEDYTQDYGSGKFDVNSAVAANIEDVSARKTAFDFTYDMDLSSAQLQLFAGWAKVEGGIEVGHPVCYLPYGTKYSIDGNGCELGAKVDVPLADRLTASFSAAWMPSFDMDGSLSNDAACWSLEGCSATDLSAVAKYALSDSCNAFLGYRYFHLAGDLADTTADDVEAASLTTLSTSLTPSPEFTTSGFFAGVGFVF